MKNKKKSRKISKKKLIEKGLNNSAIYYTYMTDDVVTMTKEEYAEMQKKFVDMEKQIETSNAEKTRIMRDSAYEKLKGINSKLAEKHKESDLTRLEIAIEVASEIKSEFSEVGEPNENPPQEEALTVGEYDQNKGAWNIE